MLRHRVDRDLEPLRSLIATGPGFSGSLPCLISEAVRGLHGFLALPERDPDPLAARSIEQQREAVEALTALLPRDDRVPRVADHFVRLSGEKETRPVRACMAAAPASALARSLAS